MLDVNVTGKNNAKKLIKQGKVDMTSSWKFTSSDRNKLLGNDDWQNYKKWFLAVDTDANKETKAYYKFPFGKNGKIYRSGVIAAKKRAAQFGYDKIEKEAKILLEMIDSASNWFKMEVKSDGSVEAFVYGVIGYECAAEEFVKEVKANKPEKLVLRINSPGGSVFEGIAIYNYLSQAKFDVDVYIDGIAASAASVIACAGTIHMPKNTLFMIHNPSALVAGQAEDMRKEAEVLDKIQDSIVNIYQYKSGLERDFIINLVNDETWLSAEEAKEYGFCDKIIEPLKEMAVFDLSKIYNNVPDFYCKRSIEMSKEKEFFVSLFETMGIDADIDSADVEEAYNYIKSRFVPEESSNEPALPSDVVAKMKEYENKIAALETANLVKQIESKVGAEIASLLGRSHKAMQKDVFDTLVKKIEGLRKAVDDLGDSRGSTEVPENVVENVDGVVEKKMKEISDELGCSMVDALVELAKRDPELIANWR